MNTPQRRSHILKLKLSYYVYASHLPEQVFALPGISTWAVDASQSASVASQQDHMIICFDKKNSDNTCISLLTHILIAEYQKWHINTCRNQSDARGALLQIQEYPHAGTPRIAGRNHTPLVTVASQKDHINI